MMTSGNGGAGLAAGFERAMRFGGVGEGVALARLAFGSVHEE